MRISSDRDKNMNYKMIARVLGMVLVCLACLMILPIVTGFYYGETDAVSAFICVAAVTAFLGYICLRAKPESTELYAREGFAAVGLVWISVALLGSLPFYLSGDVPVFVDALFESVSGFTTTGATVLKDIEAMSRSCLLWRLFSQWIGGMGVLVFMLAVMPMSGEHSMHIMRAEFPGPAVGKLVPRARQTALILYLIYIGLTVLSMLAYKLSGISWYEALVHAFATAGTGGFSTRNGSLGAFGSLGIEMTASVFVLLFSINFNVYYCFLVRRTKAALKSEELRWFFAIIAFGVLTIALNLRGYYGSFMTALRHAFFNTSMSISTTSFSVADYTKWPQYSQLMLMLLMLIGGCAGSTCGGLKLSRFMVLIKSAASDLKGMVHPRSVNPVQIDGRRMKPEAVRAIQNYFFIYMMIIFVCTLLVSLDGFDAATNFSSALACLSNIGPGLGINGPYGDYSMFSPLSKMVLALVMLLGRLELYPLLALAAPSTWKK